MLLELAVHVSMRVGDLLMPHHPRLLPQYACFLYCRCCRLRDGIASYAEIHAVTPEKFQSIKLILNCHYFIELLLRVMIKRQRYFFMKY